MHVDETMVQHVVDRLEGQGLDGMDLRRAFEEVVAVLPPLVGADGAGILIADEAQVLRHACSTDGGGQILESVQASTGRGPCVDSLVDNASVAVSDILADERWPELGPLLAPHGVRAVIGVPIRVGGVSLGSVNVYNSSPCEWDESDQAALSAIEGVVERLLTSALLAERQDELIGQLRQALEVRVMVERAVGVLMVVEDLDPAAAFERLRRAARSARRPVRAVAREVIAARTLPDPGGAHRNGRRARR